MARDVERQEPNGDDTYVNDYGATTATEDAPLLRPDATTATAAGDSVPNGGTQQSGSGPPSLSRQRAVAIILSMWALIFLQASNMSGMTMTQSVIAADLNAYDEAMWFTSSYLITQASLAPVVGRLAMIFSPGIMILISSVFFSIGAVVASQARSFASFILGRVLVGVGGAGILTLSFILVIQLTAKRRRGLFVGMINAGFTIGLSTGAVVFGALLSAVGWRVLFLMQSPIGILAGIGVFFSLPPFEAHSSAKDKSTLQKLAGIDYAGAITMTTAIVLFLYGLSGDIQALPLVLSAVSLAGFIAIEYLVAADPIIPLKVLQNRGALLSCVAQLGLMAARWTVLFYSPVFVLAVRGLGPAIAGSVLIPTNAGFGSGGLLVGWLHVRRAGSFWLPSWIAVLLFGAALALVGEFSTAAASPAVYVLAVFANGLCTGAALNYTLAHLLHLAPPDMHFVATGLLATFRGFAGSFGTAIGGGIFNRRLRDALTEGFARLDLDSGSSLDRALLVKKLVGSPALVFGGGLSDAERAVAVAGYEVALRTLYRSAVVLCVLVVLVQASTGWAAPEGVKGHEEEEEEEIIQEEIAEHDANMEA